jgi:hypothetical protein
MFFYLTNVALDVTFGATWWIVKTGSVGLYNGIHYLIYGQDTTSNIPPPLMIEYNGLTDEIRELREELQSLKKTNITQ